MPTYKQKESQILKHISAYNVIGTYQVQVFATVVQAAQLYPVYFQHKSSQRRRYTEINHQTILLVVGSA